MSATVFLRREQCEGPDQKPEGDKGYRKERPGRGGGTQKHGRIAAGKIRGSELGEAQKFNN